MFNRILKQMREKIRACQYIMTLHAEEEMSDDDLTVFDVEHAIIIIGKIVERQRDQKTGEWKFLVKGKALTGNEIIVVTKLSPTDKLVIITAYGT